MLRSLSCRVNETVYCEQARAREGDLPHRRQDARLPELRLPDALLVRPPLPRP